MSTIEVKEPKIEESWRRVLKNEFNSDYFKNLKAFLLEEKKKKVPIYPPGSLIFNAFNHCPFENTRVVILGQDPYHGPGQAHGLCFSVQDGVDPPPSLQNIFKELNEDCHVPFPRSGNLQKWADQGVMLLNSSLTVRAHQAGSHQGKGWEIFTDKVVQILNEQKSGLVFLLWGRPAQDKGKLINTDKHYVLKAPHPSPLSSYRGFFGCKHFSKTNEILKQNGQKPIDWNLT